MDGARPGRVANYADVGIGGGQGALRVTTTVGLRTTIGGQTFKRTWLRTMMVEGMEEKKVTPLQDGKN